MANDNTLREEVRDWLAEHWSAERATLLKEKQEVWGASDELKTWLGEVVEAGWAVPRWPVEWYGRAMNDAQAKIITREFAKAGAPGSGQDPLEPVGQHPAGARYRNTQEKADRPAAEKRSGHVSALQ